jgi:hypothetical protein
MTEMSNEKETPEDIEAANRFEEDMELINRGRVERNSIVLPASTGSVAGGIATGVDKAGNVLGINANTAREALRARELATSEPTETPREKAIADFKASVDSEESGTIQ